jgi:hypothetical protein
MKWIHAFRECIAIDYFRIRSHCGASVSPAATCFAHPPCCITDCKMAPSSIVFEQFFVKIDHVVQKLKQRKTYTNKESENVIISCALSN